MRSRKLFFASLLVPVQPDCKTFPNKDCYWKPVDNSLRIVKLSTIRRPWEKLIDTGFNPTEPLRTLEIYWPNEHVSTKLRRFTDVKREVEG